MNPFNQIIKMQFLNIFHYYFLALWNRIYFFIFFLLFFSSNIRCYNINIEFIYIYISTKIIYFLCTNSIRMIILFLYMINKSSFFYQKNRFHKIIKNHYHCVFFCHTFFYNKIYFMTWFYIFKYLFVDKFFRNWFHINFIFSR